MTQDWVVFNQQLIFAGASSTQVQSVKNAWCAVGVGTCSTASGFTEYSNNLNYNLYPNPAKGKVSIIMNHQSSELKVNITNYSRPNCSYRK